MSNLRTEGYRLGSIEKEVIRALAHKGSQTINATKNIIKGHGKSVNNAFHSLEEKKLIEVVGQREYRNRIFNLFWLTFDGMVIAITHKAGQEVMKENYEKIHGKSEETDFLFEFAKAFPNKINDIYSMFKTAERGQLTLKSMPIADDEMRKFLRIIIKYPEFRKLVKKAMRVATKEFNKMLEN